MCVMNEKYRIVALIAVGEVREEQRYEEHRIYEDESIILFKKIKKTIYKCEVLLFGYAVVPSDVRIPMEWNCAFHGNLTKGNPMIVTFDHERVFKNENNEELKKEVKEYVEQLINKLRSIVANRNDIELYIDIRTFSDVVIDYVF